MTFLSSFPNVTALLLQLQDVFSAPLRECSRKIGEDIATQINLPPVAYAVTFPTMYSRFFKNKLILSTNIVMEIGWLNS